MGLQVCLCTCSNGSLPFLLKRGLPPNFRTNSQHQLLFSIVRNPHWQQLQSSQPRPPIVEATLFSSSLPLATTTSHSFLHCEQTLAATNFLSSMKRRQHQHCFLSTIHDSSNNTSSPPSSEATTTAVPQSLFGLDGLIALLARASSNEAMLPLTSARKLSKMTEKLSKTMLDGGGITTGSAMTPLVKSQDGKAFLSMVPGEVLLASLDATETELLT
ncbi:SPARTIN [Salix viminalis]|uniref:SPARTIN n=1 Tax=Salix viminalis TaxID=40686 RepID=A0A9Q0ZQ61_SALVM|nr:SPARTIN [Salix viminalis]